MKMFSFEIPFRLPSLNDYTDDCRACKFKGSSVKKETENSIIPILKTLKFKIECPVFVDFIWYEQSKRRDKDNVAFAKKFILDAMQKSNLLVNDNNKYILGFTDKFIYGEGDKVKVIIRIGENQ